MFLAAGHETGLIPIGSPGFVPDASGGQCRLTDPLGRRGRLLSDAGPGRARLRRWQPPWTKGRKDKVGIVLFCY